MTDWNCCKIKDAPLEIIDGDRSKNYPSQNEFSNEGHCLFLSTKNVRKSGFDFTEKQFISKSKDNLLRKGKLIKNDIVLTTRGTIGNLAFYNEDIPFENIRINSGMVIIRPDEKMLDPTFCFYFFRKLINNFDHFASGSAQPQLPIKDLKEIEIYIPQISEQKAIASVLSSLDDKIDLLHRQNKTLEAMAETIFKQWFIEESVDNPYRRILLGDLIDSVSITYKFLNEHVMFLNTSDIYEGEVLNHKPTDINSLPGQAKKTIERNDILFSEIRPANSRYAYVDFDASNYVVSTKLMVLRSKGIIKQSFVYFYLINPKTIEWLQTLAEARSGTFPQITFDNLKTLVINIPSEIIWQKATNWCETALQKMMSNKQQIRTLEKLRNILLPKLMNGEIRIKPE